MVLLLFAVTNRVWCASAAVLSLQSSGPWPATGQNRPRAGLALFAGVEVDDKQHGQEASAHLGLRYCVPPSKR